MKKALLIAITVILIASCAVLFWRKSHAMANHGAAASAVKARSSVTANGSSHAGPSFDELWEAYDALQSDMNKQLKIYKELSKDVDAKHAAYGNLGAKHAENADIVAALELWRKASDLQFEVWKKYSEIQEQADKLFLQIGTYTVSPEFDVFEGEYFDDEDQKKEQKDQNLTDFLETHTGHIVYQLRQKMNEIYEHKMFNIPKNPDLIINPSDEDDYGILERVGSLIAPHDEGNLLNMEAINEADNGFYAIGVWNLHTFQAIDDELLSVLYHEYGHLREKHSMFDSEIERASKISRVAQYIAAGAAAAVAGGAWATGVGVTAALFPEICIGAACTGLYGLNKYYWLALSRKHELEADAIAVRAQGTAEPSIKFEQRDIGPEEKSWSWARQLAWRSLYNTFRRHPHPLDRIAAMQKVEAELLTQKRNS